MENTISLGGLKLVIAVRHGDAYRTSDCLTDFGKEEVVILVSRLRSIIPMENRVLILSSPAERAIQSADIIAKIFNVPAQICNVLETNSYFSGTILKTAIIAGIKDGECDAVIAVTHGASPSGVINAFSTQFFQKKTERFESDNGNGCMINLETGEVSKNLLS